MDEETIIPTETQDGVSTEPPADPTESTAAETVPETERATVPEESTVETTEETTIDFIPDETDVRDDYYWDTLPDATEYVEETVQETIPEETTNMDYIYAIANSTSVISNFVLCGALMIVGTLVALRIWR